MELKKILRLSEIDFTHVALTGHYFYGAAPRINSSSTALKLRPPESQMTSYCSYTTRPAIVNRFVSFSLEFYSHGCSTQPFYYGVTIDLKKFSVKSYHVYVPFVD